MQTYFSREDVLSRPGWTAKRIATLLGAPDVRRPVQGKPTGLCLYGERRLADAEQLPEFKRAAAALAARRERREGPNPVLTAWLRQVSRIALDVTVWPDAQLRQLAVDAHNQHADYADRLGDMETSEAVAQAMVLFVVQQGVSLDQGFLESAVRAGFPEVLAELQHRVLLEIADRYPELQEACAETHLSDDEFLALLG